MRYLKDIPEYVTVPCIGYMAEEYTVLHMHPILEFLSRINSLSRYGVNNIADSTPPCLTPLDIVKYSV